MLNQGLMTIANGLEEGGGLGIFLWKPRQLMVFKPKTPGSSSVVQLKMHYEFYEDIKFRIATWRNAEI